MDNLVLIRVAAVLDAQLRRAVLEEIGAEGPHRYRLAFGVGSSEGARRASLIVSLRPELPGVGRPARRRTAALRRSDPFVAESRRALCGALVEAISKPGSDRSLCLRFGSGHALVAELATHGANLVLLDADGRVLAAARHPRAARDRLRIGEPYRSRPLPAGAIDPFGSDAAALDAAIEREMAEGEPLLEAIRRRLFGLGTPAAELVIAESRAAGRSPGTVLAARLAQLAAGEGDPVITGAPDDPVDLASRSPEAIAGLRLWPWDPDGPDSPVRRNDAAGTAGLYHEAVEAAAEVSGRMTGLCSILDREIDRLWGVEAKVAADLEAFEDPERFRHWGEALLAGLSTAERFGDQVRVADPYESGATIVVPAPGGLSLPEAAELHFRKHRRAKRGLDSARRRRAEVVERRSRLERLRADAELRGRGIPEIERLEHGMRAEGIPVGLVRSSKNKPVASTGALVEGVRIFTAPDGASILVGRSGKANDRLTFKIAGPEDFWLHVQGRPGAHVIIRNPGNHHRPSRAALLEAATLAAWFSSGRDDSGVDVHWTRRKNVRRLRGAPPGTVKLKRFETVRVRPRPPRDGRMGS